MASATIIESVFLQTPPYALPPDIFLSASIFVIICLSIYYRESPTVTSDNENQRKLQELQKAFEEFSKSTEGLQGSYNALQEEARKLNRELEEKNRSLEESLGEQQRLRTFMEQIIQNIPGGIAVIGKNNQPLVWNANYVSLMEQCNLEDPFHLIKDKSGCINLDDQGITLGYKVSPQYKLENFMENYRVVFIEDETPMVEMSEKLKRRENLASMGEMAASIAHEIRNPLGGIKLFASMLDKEVSNQQDLHEMTQHIMKGTNNIESIIKNMLFFAKQPSPILSNISLKLLIEELISFYQASAIYENIRFDMPNDEDIIISADKELIIQALHNLFLNAIQASSEKSPLTVGLKRGKRKTVELSISDEGKGMTKEQQKKIFNPFFTTKGRGTGLGMTIVNTVVMAHNGDIEIKSKPGKGTTMRIILPAESSN